MRFLVLALALAGCHVEGRPQSPARAAPAFRILEEGIDYTLVCAEGYVYLKIRGPYEVYTLAPVFNSENMSLAKRCPVRP
jgi:hypothetical protein